LLIATRHATNSSEFALRARPVTAVTQDRAGPIGAHRESNDHGAERRRQQPDESWPLDLLDDRPAADEHDAIDP
jgi:hypothetical protein